MLNEDVIAVRLAALDGWALTGSRQDRIVRIFEFPGYHETIAFVNAVAWIAQRVDHHPDMAVGFNRCSVSFTTHDVGGLSNLDFDSAARIDALFS